MPLYSDVYVLAPDRSPGVIARYLDHFAPRREEMAEEFQVPRFADNPTHRFRRAAELVDYLAAHPREPQSIYWRNMGGRPAYVMAFFTTDAALILGLSCFEEEADAWLTQLRAFAGVGRVCILFEKPPPDSASEFLSLVEAIV